MQSLAPRLCHVSEGTRRKEPVRHTWHWGRARQWLEQSYHARQPALYLGILSLDGLLGPQGSLKVLVGLLGGQFLDLSLQVLDLVLCPLADGPLRLSVCGRQSAEVHYLTSYDRRG